MRICIPASQKKWAEEAAARGNVLKLNFALGVVEEVPRETSPCPICKTSGPEEVLRLQGRLGPDRPTTKSYTVPCSAYDLVIKPAFELIRMRLGSQRRDAEGKALEYSDGAVLECMCAEVLSDVHNQPEDELPMEEK